MCSARTSTAPVPSFGFTVPSGRGATPPRTSTTNSDRSPRPASIAHGPASGAKTTWVFPYRSRRSMNRTPPWSR